MAITFQVNGVERVFDIDDDTPLLWALRDELGLTGTKFGCGMNRCGACTVHVDGEARRSCVLPISRLEGRSITTIEGLSETGDHPLQKAWVEVAVPQCGYCQAGQIMKAAELLAENPKPSDDDIDRAMRPNLCRCGTYVRIRKAIHIASTNMSGAGKGQGTAQAGAGEE